MKKVIGWWSGGITSTVAIKKAIDIYGKENVRVIFIDTKNEDEDTYRFMKDCEKWYDIEIETISSDKHNSVPEVWYRYKALNNAKGAVCSSEMKRLVREQWEKNNEWSYQVFGFEMDEHRRAKSMTLNYPHINPIYPLMMFGLSKKDCINIVQDAGINVPRAYQYGFLNNNCLQTGCVQGGIGYWQKMSRDFPEKFNRMADVEFELTSMKGKPVTMLKDQSNEAKKLVKETGNKELQFVFLRHNPNYPHIKDISQMKGREPKPLVDCNGFCGINDLEKRNETEGEINMQGSLF